MQNQVKENELEEKIDVAEKNLSCKIERTDRDTQTDVQAKGTVIMTDVKYNTCNNCDGKIKLCKQTIILTNIIPDINQNKQNNLQDILEKACRCGLQVSCSV